MNMNELAKLITQQEGKKKSLSIAQVKEVIGLVALALVQDTQTLQNLLTVGQRKQKKLLGK